MGETGSRSGLVGRGDDVRSVVALLRRSQQVTLVGPGGIGKTRLAAEVAAELETEYDRVVWLDLTATSVNDGFEPFLNQYGSPYPSSTLVVVDNCEHVVASAAEAVRQLRATGQPTVVLATSRRPLQISHEHLYPVRTLSIPPLGEPPRALQAWESVQLFLERALQTNPDFELDEANADAVAAVCRQSGGLPLVLELAAGLTRSRPLRDIASAMSETGSSSLQRNRRDVRPHQRSIAESVSWSLELIDADERDLLETAAVFRGTFTAAALDAVHVQCEDHSAAIVQLLDALVEQSLVSFAPKLERFSMLAIVADAVRTSTKPERATQLVERHAEWAMAQATEIANRTLEPDASGAFARFTYDLPDLTHVADTYLRSDDMKRWVALVGPVAQWWVHYGGPVDRDLWMSASGDCETIDANAAGLAVGLAFHLGHLGHHDESLRCANQALQQTAHLNRADITASLLIAIGNASLSMASTDVAIDAFNSALATGQQAANLYLQSIAQLGLARSATTNAERQRHLFWVTKHASDGHPALLVVAQQWLARLALEEGDVDVAETYASTSSELAGRLGFHEAIATAHNTAGSIAAHRNEYAGAEDAYRAAIAVGQRIGHIGVIGDALEGLAAVARQLNQTELAAQLTEQLDDQATPARSLQNVLAILNFSSNPAEPVVAASTLTERETAVLLLLRGDLTQREIAEELYVSPSTVRTHVKSIYKKLAVHNRTGCVHQATVLGLLPPPSLDYSR